MFCQSTTEYCRNASAGLNSNTKKHNRASIAAMHVIKILCVRICYEKHRT